MRAPAFVRVGTEDSSELYSLYGIITVTFAPAFAAVTSAFVRSDEISQTLTQMVFPFGMTEVKKFVDGASVPDCDAAAL
jgi:hypothetical protein